MFKVSGLKSSPQISMRLNFCLLVFQFVLLCVSAAVCSAGHLPVSYSSVTYHPVHVVKVVKPEWKAEEWKPAAVEWKPAAVEWKPAAVEWKPAAVEWKPAPVEWKEPEAPANYDFKYEVHDEHTGDLKRQSETAVNGAVKGQYSLIDSDGYKRIVEYTADDHHGFQATVKREPTHYKVPVPAPKVIAHEQAWW
jgi:hypothetical protein